MEKDAREIEWYYVHLLQKEFQRGLEDQDFQLKVGGIELDKLKAGREM